MKFYIDGTISILRTTVTLSVVLTVAAFCLMDVNVGYIFEVGARNWLITVLLLACTPFGLNKAHLYLEPNH